MKHARVPKALSSPLLCVHHLEPTAGKGLFKMLASKAIPIKRKRGKPNGATVSPLASIKLEVCMAHAIS